MTAPQLMNWLKKPARKPLVRSAVGLLALGLLATPTLVAGAGNAATSDPMWRKVSAPNVFFPLGASKAVKDLHTYKGRRPGTDIEAPCNATVRASHPGTAIVRTSPRWNGRFLVKVISNNSGLVTGYAYLSRALVQDGQIIQSGQPIGLNGRNPVTGKCRLYYTVSQSGRALNPSSWLSYHVGQAPPVARLFNAPGINLASYNFLGASHTVRSSKFATYGPRMVKSVNLIKSRGLDVVGAQELQQVQRDYFRKLTGTTYDSYNFVGPKGHEDTDNSIIWKRSTMELVSAETFTIPYFHGNTRNVPAVLLRQKSTGRTAYFINVHNPADVEGPAARYRAQAIAIERAKIISLRASGRPVFITGDFNDRQAAFCPMTAGKLTISPNSIPSMSCAYPAQTSIDWIFAAGQARFSSFVRDKYTQTYRLSDHPIVITRTHLQD